MANRKGLLNGGYHVTVRLPDADAERLKAIAERDERSVSWVVRRAVRDYVANFGEERTAA